MSGKKLNELIVYSKAMELGKEVWEIVQNWDTFSRDTVGKQWVRSTDSIAANIAEGHGRFHYKENRLFCYYSRGSVQESKTWLIKAHQRKLIDEKMFARLLDKLEHNNALLNNYIRSIGP